jgi:hypothetical protein
MSTKKTIGLDQASAILLALVVSMLAVTMDVHPAAAIEQMPHRAVYDLALKSTGSDSGIMGVRGRMVLEWADACEGYTTTQQIRMRIEQSQGKLIASDFSVASWESKDGNQFQFKIRNVIDGDLVEKFGGLAKREGADQKGAVSMKKPAPSTIPLPAGTVFPSEHASILTREAQNGAKRIEVRVFDGTGEEGLFDAIAFVTSHVAGGESATGLAELDDQEAWHMRMAYYRVGDTSGLPDYEVGFRLFANGVADQLILDYGNFVVGSKMSHFEALPASGC